MPRMPAAEGKCSALGLGRTPARWEGLAIEDVPVVLRIFGELEAGSKCTGAGNQTRFDFALIQSPGQVKQVAAIFYAVAEELSDKHVRGIHQKHVQVSKAAQRVDALTPACRKIMRLKMSNS